jgi:hypothetical protein
MTIQILLHFSCTSSFIVAVIYKHSTSNETYLSQVTKSTNTPSRAAKIKKGTHTHTHTHHWSVNLTERYHFVDLRTDVKTILK